MFWISWAGFISIHGCGVFSGTWEIREIVADPPAYRSFDWVDPKQVDCKAEPTKLMQ